MIVCQPVPSERATAATDSPSRPTRRMACQHARPVSTARGAMWSLVAGSGQRQRRLTQRSRTHRSKASTSHTSVTGAALGVRPHPAAFTPGPLCGRGHGHRQLAVHLVASHEPKPEQAEHSHIGTRIL
jgi:hypothetical protein